MEREQGDMANWSSRFDTEIVMRVLGDGFRRLSSEPDKKPSRALAIRGEGRATLMNGVLEATPQADLAGILNGRVRQHSRRTVKLS